MSAGQLARQRSSSSGTRPAVRAATPIDPRTTDIDFEPCAATGSIFLFAQGSTVICLHHDTLALDRRFELHKEQILYISVDNVSERGAGRLVVSYDAGSNAIVWDLFTGLEVAKFQSYEPIRAAAWMKNGNVAFGNTSQFPLETRVLTCIPQATRRATLFYLSPQLLSMYQHAPSLTRSQQLRQLGIARLMRLGQ